MVGTTAAYPSHEHHEHHELQALPEDMAAESSREYQAMANVDSEEEPLVAAYDDMSDIPAKGMSSDISP
jgi:hypothetical protein